MNKVCFITYYSQKCHTIVIGKSFRFNHATSPKMRHLTGDGSCSVLGWVANKVGKSGKQQQKNITAKSKQVKHIFYIHVVCTSGCQGCN